MVLTTVKAKNAFRPMPGAMPIGQLAISAITSEPSAAAAGGDEDRAAVHAGGGQDVRVDENDV